MRGTNKTSYTLKKSAMTVKPFNGHLQNKRQKITSKINREHWKWFGHNEVKWQKIDNDNLIFKTKW